MSTVIQVECPEMEEVDCLYKKKLFYFEIIAMQTSIIQILFPDAFLLCRLCALSSLVACMHICVSVNDGFIILGKYVSD